MKVAYNSYTPSTFISNSDLKYFERMYEEKLLERGGDKILFVDLKDVLINSGKPGKQVLNDQLEKLKKKMKESGGLSDNELFISK